MNFRQIHTKCYLPKSDGLNSGVLSCKLSTNFHSLTIELNEEIYSKRDLFQEFVAKALDLPQHKVTVRTKRIGGGFGGKESSSSIFAVPAAIGAVKLHRPVKIVMERFDDMAISGTRHPFRCDYKCGISSDGKLQRLEMNFYSNCGYFLDLSMGVMRSFFSFSNFFFWLFTWYCR